ncbi:MAG: UDP-glucuronic acid decarboxylase family protein [Betaproteobacteria bacterium]
MTLAAERRALVTGGAGFLGSHLCERLLDSGYEVLCVDNLRTGALENIAHLMGRSRFTFVRHDIVEPLDAKADEIYNLACPASPVQYQEDPIQTLKSSVCGAMNLLELAQRTGAKILQASTSEVYGDPQVHPQSETYWGHVNPIGPRSCYDEGKRCAETFFSDYRRRRGVEARIARIFNTYGPRMQADDGRVVSNFIVQALRRGTVTVYGDGSQTRSFCYVTDLVEGLVRLMSRSGKLHAPVNLGNPRECTVLELARLVVRMTGSSSRVEFKPLPQDDPVRRCPDIAAARSILKWTPRVSLQQGLMRTIDYFAARLGSRAAVSSGAAHALSGGSS